MTYLCSVLLNDVGLLVDAGHNAVQVLVLISHLVELALRVKLVTS